jgi:NTP pyrophosphatase (non-canonical NTP hydrolase)
MKNLKEMQAEVREVNEANGWFENDRTVGDDIALLHSEASEMFEAYRDGGLADHTSYRWHHLTCARGEAQARDGGPHDDVECTGSPRDCIPPKPEGFGSECADVLIRLLDTCERRGVDLDWEIERKLAYNRTRGHRHGGKLV